MVGRARRRAGLVGGSSRGYESRSVSAAGVSSARQEGQWGCPLPHTEIVGRYASAIAC